MACTKGVGSAPIALPDGKLYNEDEIVIPPSVTPYVKGVVLPGGTARNRIEKMAFDVRSHYQAGELHIVSLLEGARVFSGALTDFIAQQETMAGNANSLEVFHHFVRISTYRNACASGEVFFTAEDLYCLKDKHVLVVDDVVESGNSLKYVRNWLSKFEPKSIRTAALLQVRIKEKMPVVDFTGFTAPMEWFVGFGIDFNDRFREVPHICALADKAKKEFAA